MSKNEKDSVEGLLKVLEQSLNPVALLDQKYGTMSGPAIYRVMQFMEKRGFDSKDSDFKIGVEDPYIYVASKNDRQNPVLIVDVLNNTVHVDTFGEFGPVRTQADFKAKQEKIAAFRRELFAEEIKETESWEKVASDNLEQTSLDSRLDDFDPSGLMSN